jgi:phospholipase/carboxylesterase
MLKDYRIAPASGQDPDSVVVFLHGLGDSGSGGLLEIGRLWQPFLPNTEFICPDAPFAFDMAPGSFGGRQWFSLREFSQKEVEDGILNAAPILNDYIDHILTTRKIADSRLVLVGFSQGTMMALHVAPRRDMPVAAILGYSGLLSMAERLSAEAVSKPPVFLAHGTEDDVVPFASMAASENVLKAAGFTVESLACPYLAHSVDQAGIEAGLRFILKTLGVRA